MTNLYHLFPRQVALPYRITVDKYEFYNTINRYNGKLRVFSSIYNYTGNVEYDRQAMVIDKVFFDFDGPESLPHAKKLIQKCLDNDYRFTPLFSGNGFHVYVFTNCNKLGNPRVALSKFQTQFSGMDRSSVGDIARVATVPNTYNTKRRRFCIPVRLEEIEQGFEVCKELAKTQRSGMFIYGNQPLDLSEYDGEPDIYVEKFDEPRIPVRKVESLPPCINDILSYKKKGFRGRYLVINYLKDAGYLMSQIEDIIKEYCSSEEANHCIVEERQIKYLYWKDITFPSCEQIKSEGRCPNEEFCDYTRQYDHRHLVKLYK